MKYFSEKLNKAFDTEQLCLDAEAQYEKEQAEQKKKEELAIATKKEMANAIEKADQEIDMAYDSYNKAVKQVEELKKEYDKKAEEILKPAREAIKDAQKKRFNALKEFNQKYGTYTKTYTGDKALKEFNRLDSLFDVFFPFNIFKF